MSTSTAHRVGLALAGLLLAAGSSAAGDGGAAGSTAFETMKQVAAAHDREENWPAAIRAYLEIAETFKGAPQAAFAEGQIELIAAMFLEGEARLSEADFKVMEPILADAAARDIFPAAMLLGARLRAAGRSEEAFRLFQRAAARGYPPAMVQTGLMYSNGDGVRKDLEKASSWLRPANVKGSAVGKYLLAECFLFGKGVSRNPEAAVALLRDAAEMEHPGRALDLLATCHHKGWGVEMDAAEAARLYRRACDKGYYNAYANLGVLYMTGEGVPRSPARAVRLFRDGVEEGNALCMFFYAAAHLDGLGVERDADAARAWFVRAARAGSSRAQAWCEANGVDLTTLSAATGGPVTP
jgi:TPR repeat protein